MTSRYGFQMPKEMQKSTVVGFGKIGRTVIRGPLLISIMKSRKLAAVDDRYVYGTRQARR